ncbi:MAG: oligosaccharide flippase family protein [Candidatus Neomarinimicrobiota bacterium]|nr:oligosaccharide flippase family protein [Candidatus Neomarinimicrobiota bacterium]
MQKEIISLSKNTLIYGLGHILARVVTFLLLPLYTNVFTPDEYGIISLAYVIMGFMSVVMHYGLDAALMKRYIQSDLTEKTIYFSSAWVSFFITSISFGVVITFLRKFFSPILLGTNDDRLILLVGWIIALDVMWSIPQLIFRAEEKPYAYIVFSLTNVIGSLLLNILFVLQFKMGVYGVLLSNFIISTILFIVTIPFIYNRINFKKASISSWMTMMKFGLPFLPSGVFAMMMELADRYILKQMTDLYTVGIYSSGYKLGMLMMLIVMGFNMAWQPFFLKIGGGNEYKPLYARINSYVFALLGFIWVILLLWVDNIVRIKFGSISLYGEQYWSSTLIAPWISLGYVFYGLYLMQLPGVFHQEKSLWIAISRAIGAISNIIFNLYLIPIYGGQGAAIATCISFVIMFITMFMVNSRLFPISYEWGRIVRIIFTMGIISFLYNKSSHDYTNKYILTLYYPFALLLTGFLYKSEIKIIKKTINFWPKEQKQ